MARDYGKIRAQFWTDDRVKPWSLEMKGFASYLMTCEHATALGAFRLPAAYISDDLDITPAQARGFLQALQDAGWLSFCPATGWVWIHKFLRHNKPEGGNVWKHIRSLAAAMPANVCFRDAVLASIPDSTGQISQKDAPASQSEASPELVQTSQTELRPNPAGAEPEPEPSLTEPEPEPVAASLPAPPDEAFAAYLEAAERNPAWTKHRELPRALLKPLSRRVAELGGIDGWRLLLDRCERSKWLSGRRGDRPFKLSLDYLSKPENLRKILDGNYDDAPESRQQGRVDGGGLTAGQRQHNRLLANAAASISDGSF